jgi:hypothetical protein
MHAGTVCWQVMVTAAISALALAVCCALVASADLGPRRASLMELVAFRNGFVLAPRRILYGLGSGEEQDAENHAALAFGTFSHEYADELLGQDHYAAQFMKTLADQKVPVCIRVAVRACSGAEASVYVFGL